MGVGLKGLEGILRLVFSALLFFQERFSGAAPQTYPQGSHVPLTSLLSTSLLQEPSFHHRTPSRLSDQQLSYHSCPSPCQGAAAPSPGETCLSRSDWLRLCIANLPSTSPTSLTKRQLSCGRDHFPTLHTHTHTQPSHDHQQGASSGCLHEDPSEIAPGLQAPRSVSDQGAKIRGKT